MKTQDLLKSQDRVTLLIKRLSYWLGVISMVCMLVMVIFTNSDIVLRFFFMGSVPGNVNICEILLVFSVFLGLPLAEISGSHVSMGFIFDRFPKPVQRGILFFDRLLCLCILGLLSYASITYAITQYVQGEVFWTSTTQIVLWPARFGIALGFTVFGATMLVESTKASKYFLHRKK